MLLQMFACWGADRLVAMRRQENNPRTFKEICAVVSDVSKKDIGRCYKFITKELEQAMGTIHAADYMRRFGSRLGLANKEMQAAEEAAHIACPRDGRCAWAGLLACVSSGQESQFVPRVGYRRGQEAAEQAAQCACPQIR